MRCKDSAYFESGKGMEDFLSEKYYFTILSIEFTFEGYHLDSCYSPFNTFIT